LCNDACLWETIHTFLDEDIDVSICGSLLFEIVEGNDVVWYVRHFESHVFGANHWCVKIEIFDVNGHELCTFGGDDAVEEDLGGKHVGRGCATIAGVSNSVAANSEADAVRVIFLRSVICTDSSICDVLSANRRYLVG